MSGLQEILRAHPEIAFFMVLGLGYLLGKLALGGFKLGAVTGTLLAGVLVGQLGVTLPNEVKQCFFLLFLFAAAMLRFKLTARRRDRLRDHAEDQTHGTNRIVVSGNRIIDQVRIAIRVNQRHERNLQTARFRDRIMFALDVDNEHRRGRAVQVA